MSEVDGVGSSSALSNSDADVKSCKSSSALSSPVHAITLPDIATTHATISPTDSPRSGTAKVHKPTAGLASNSGRQPARRGRRGKKNTCQDDKKIVVCENEVKSSNRPRGVPDADSVHTTVKAAQCKSVQPVGNSDDLTLMGGRERQEVTSSGGDTGEVLSDVEQAGVKVGQGHDLETESGVKGRRSTSLPAASSSHHGNRRQGQQSHKITEYFPIRRSCRMTTAELKKQSLTELQQDIRCNKHDGLRVEEIPEKGRGVVATRPFTKGQFVVEYAGDLCDLGVAKQRERDYSAKLHVGCYMYYFQHGNKSYCVDATKESGLLGRLVNHSRLAFNCVTKVVDVDGRPRLILVASRDVTAGEELLYDYGDRSKDSLLAYPWLAA